MRGNERGRITIVPYHRTFLTRCTKCRKFEERRENRFSKSSNFCFDIDDVTSLGSRDSKGYEIDDTKNGRGDSEGGASRRKYISGGKWERGGRVRKTRSAVWEVCDSHAWWAIYTYLSGLGIECYRSGPWRLRPR